MRAEFWIRTTEEPPGYSGIVFEIDSFESRVEFRFRTGFGVGGRRGWRARLQRPALLNSVFNCGRSPRILQPRAGPATIFSRARLAALCGLWTGDMHQFSSSCGHEQGVKLYRKGVQTIFDLLPQMRVFGGMDGPGGLKPGFSASPRRPCPLRGPPRGLRSTEQAVSTATRGQKGQLRT